MVTLSRLQSEAADEFGMWLRERKNCRFIPHRLEGCGYVPVRNPDTKDNLWKINQSRQVIYAKDSLSLAEQITAARKLQEQGR